MSPSATIPQRDPVVDENGAEHRVDDRIGAVRVGEDVVTLDFNAAVAVGKVDATTVRKMIVAVEKRLGQWR